MGGRRARVDAPFVSISVSSLRRGSPPAARPAASKGTLAAAGVAAVAAAAVGFAAFSEGGAPATASDPPSTAGTLSALLAPGQRAVTLPVDAAHGMAGDIAASDRVDLYGSYQMTTKADPTARPIVKLLAQNVRVLRAPRAPEPGATAAPAATQITVGLGAQTAVEAAFTADNGKVWVAARPAGATPRVPPRLVTTESLLFGIKPVVETVEEGAAKPAAKPASAKASAKTARAAGTAKATRAPGAAAR